MVSQLLRSGWLNGFDYYTYHWMLDSNFLALLVQTILAWNLASYIGAVVVVVYLTALSSLAWIMAKVLYISVPFMYFGLYYVSLPYSLGMYPGLLGILWVVAATRRYFQRVEKKPYQELDINTMSMLYAREPSQVERERGRVLGVRGGVFVIIAVVVLVAVAPAEYKGQLSMLIPMVWVLVSADAFPGVGGNSNSLWGAVLLLISMLFGMLMAPGFYTIAMDSLVRTFAPRNPDTPAVNMVNEAAQFLSWKIGFPVVAIETDSCLSLLVGIMGYFCMAWLVIDDFYGPTYFQTALMQVKTRKDNNQLPTILSGMFGAPSLVAFGVDVLACFYGQSYVRLMVATIGATMAYACWHYLGTKIWAGRGMAADTVNTRGDVACFFGDGPKGFRVLLFRAASFLGMLRFLNQYMGPAAMIATAALSFMTMKSEFLTMLTTGFTTANWSLVLMAICNSFPLTGSLHMAATQAYQMEGGNSTTGPLTYSPVKEVETPPVGTAPVTTPPIVGLLDPG